MTEPHRKKEVFVSVVLLLFLNFLPGVCHAQHITAKKYIPAGEADRLSSKYYLTLGSGFNRNETYNNMFLRVTVRVIRGDGSGTISAEDFASGAGVVKILVEDGLLTEESFR